MEEVSIIHTRDVWKCYMTVYGEQCVIMDSQKQQQESSADLLVSGTFRLVMFIYEEDIDTI